MLYFTRTTIYDHFIYLLENERGYTKGFKIGILDILTCPDLQFPIINSSSLPILA